MSLLAHACYAARGFEAERRDLDRAIQAEVREAKRIQHEVGCSWSEALRLAADVPTPKEPSDSEAPQRERNGG
jgi:hypothetical protein